MKNKASKSCNSVLCPLYTCEHSANIYEHFLGGGRLQTPAIQGPQTHAGMCVATISSSYFWFATHVPCGRYVVNTFASSRIQFCHRIRVHHVPGWPIEKRLLPNVYVCKWGALCSFHVHIECRCFYCVGNMDKMRT